MGRADDGRYNPPAMRRSGLLLALPFLLVATTAAADPIVPGPGQAGHDAALALKAEAYARQLNQLISISIGFGLEAFVEAPADRAVIDDFFASGAADFAAHTGRHPYEVISRYGEHGDLGMFGGVQAAGEAFRYAVLRDSGAPAAEVDEARRVLLGAMDGLHWQTQVTGEPGIVARGIRRSRSEAGEPPIPGGTPATLPLFDASGAPQPADKEPTWRDDLSGELPFLVWIDDCSKDQLDGYVFALGAIYDVVWEDETIPRDVVDRLVEDARAIGRQLMERIEVAPGVVVDLVIQDADGRPTTFHDLSAEEVTPGGVFPGMPAVNGFNGLMGLGTVRTLFHITGDEAHGRFYYEELIEGRDYLSSVEESVALMYLGDQTNFSNVNMAFVAAYGVLRYEGDETLGLRMRTILHDWLYAPNLPREARGLGQSLFDYIYAAFKFGDRAPARTAVGEGTRTLAEFPDPPYWDIRVDNCDDAEIAARSCTAIDGSTIVLSDGSGRGDNVVAVDPLPKRIRPPSNFEWRSDPHDVNGGGGSRLNPGGDFHAAYWMGRYLELGTTGFENVSPLARPAPPRSPRPDAGVAATDGGGTPPGSEGDDGCGCTAAGRPGTGPTATCALLLALAVLRRRRRRRRWPTGGSPGSDRLP